MSEQQPDKFEERAKREAFYRWVREGRPSLTKEEQDRMFFEELEKIHLQHASPWWFRLRWLYPGYCGVAFLVLMGLLCLSSVYEAHRIAGWWSLVILGFMVALLAVGAIVITRRVRSAFTRKPPELTASEPRRFPQVQGRLFTSSLITPSPWLSWIFLIAAWMLVAALLLGVTVLVYAKIRLTPSLIARDGINASTETPAADATLPSEATEEEVSAVNKALLYSILIGFALFSFVLMFVAVSIKVKLDHEQERLKESLPESKRWWWEFWHLLLLEIGIAIFVSFFIAATLEFILHHRVEEEHKRYMQQQERIHKRQMEEQQRNLFKYLFGFHINPRLGGEIFQTLQDASKFHREYCALLFEFDTLADADRKRYARDCKYADELIVVRLRVSYQIHNSAPSPQKFTVEPYFMNPLQLDGMADEFIVFEVNGCEAADKCVEAGVWGEEKLRSKFTSEGLRRQLHLGDICVNPTRPTHVCYTYRMVMRSTDCHSWISVLPMDSLKIQASIVDSHLDLDFGVETAHREEVTAFGNARHALSKVWEWHIEDPLLPNQGIILYWHPSNHKLKPAKPIKKLAVAPIPNEKYLGQ
ncbi:MAG: hypothetical protein ACRELG_12960 [Gemmataceae bacterium]